MNNRKLKNSRGVNPRGSYTQVIVEKPTIVREINGEEPDSGKRQVTIPNPRFPGTRVINHRNF